MSVCGTCPNGKSSNFQLFCSLCCLFLFYKLHIWTPAGPKNPSNTQYIPQQSWNISHNKSNSSVKRNDSSDELEAPRIFWKSKDHWVTILTWIVIWTLWNKVADLLKPFCYFLKGLQQSLLSSRINPILTASIWNWSQIQLWLGTDMKTCLLDGWRKLDSSPIFLLMFSGIISFLWMTNNWRSPIGGMLKVAIADYWMNHSWLKVQSAKPILIDTER